MKHLAITVPLLLLLSGCQQAAPTQQAINAEPAKEPATEQLPASFQIRDFNLDKDTASYGGATYKGRATLITKDPRFTRGNYLVYVTVKQEHENDEEANLQIIMKDGIGTIRVSTYQSSDEEKNKEKVRYYDWNILGYAALTPGKLETPESGTTKTSDNQQ